MEAEFVLKATILGDSPVAYLANGNAMRLVRVGDVVDGRRVQTIDARGILMNDGRRLDLASSATTRVTPAAQGHLRAASTNVPTHPRLLTPSMPVLLTPPPVSMPSALPTPAPPPTIKPGAYPLGSRPSGDPLAPTAFPYPYPYPPK
jgi:hypothetical protein